MCGAGSSKFEVIASLGYWNGLLGSSLGNGGAKMNPRTIATTASPKMISSGVRYADNGCCAISPAATTASLPSSGPSALSILRSASVRFARPGRIGSGWPCVRAWAGSLRSANDAPLSGGARCRGARLVRRSGGSVEARQEALDQLRHPERADSHADQEPDQREDEPGTELVVDRVAAKHAHECRHEEDETDL